MLHALILHFIKSGRYRSALEELEMYLTSYPYLLCGPLHTYAGMLSFFLAQPESARHDPASLAAMTANAEGAESGERRRRRSSSVKRRSSVRGSRSARLLSEASATTDTTDSSQRTATTGSREPANPLMVSRAKAHFIRALEVDKGDNVAKEFITVASQQSGLIVWLQRTEPSRLTRSRVMMNRMTKICFLCRTRTRIRRRRTRATST